MEIVYLLNGTGGGGSSAGAGYGFVRAAVVDGAVGLRNGSVTRIELGSSDPVRIVLPERVDGVARDFILRLVITADAVPEITFAPHTGETVSFEKPDENVFSCIVGVNVLSFTETESGVFLVCRKSFSSEGA